jgi:hypothetical protein
MGIDGRLLAALLSKLHTGADVPSHYYRLLSMLSFGAKSALAGARAALERSVGSGNLSHPSIERYNHSLSATLPDVRISSRALVAGVCRLRRCRG